MAAHRPSLVILGTATLALSTAFPIVASLLSGERVPRGAGVVDVALAVAVLSLALGIDLRSRGRVHDEAVKAAFRFYQTLAVFPLALLAIFFLGGAAIRWEILLPGLAWRTWVLMHVFPGACALWVQGGGEGPGSGDIAVGT